MSILFKQNNEKTTEKNQEKKVQEHTKPWMRRNSKKKKNKFYSLNEISTLNLKKKNEIKMKTTNYS